MWFKNKTNPSCVNRVQLEPTSLYVCKDLANKAVSDSKCRVDGKEMISVPQRRLSFDCKTSKPVFTQQSDIISHTTSHDDMEKVFLYLSAVQRLTEFKRNLREDIKNGALFHRVESVYTEPTFKSKPGI